MRKDKQPEAKYATTYTITKRQMNKDWSELNSCLQAQIKKKDSFKSGIDSLFKLRNDLFRVILSFRKDLSRKDFDAIPFINAKGYQSKTIAYSIWHIFRIEDMVLHTLINDDEQIFFRSNYQERIDSPIITTGNELAKYQIADFSKNLNLDELYSYNEDDTVGTTGTVEGCGILQHRHLLNVVGRDVGQDVIELSAVQR